MAVKLSIVKLFGICILLTLTTNFPSGFTNSSINTAVEELKRGVVLTDFQQAVVRSGTLNCWYVAQVFGYFVAPLLTDRFGRKVAYLTASTGMLSAGILQFVAALFGLPELFILGRSLCAFCSPISDASLLLYLQVAFPSLLIS
uniref:MFS domain-containing protein n=1 Tax=Syphacia muris TaxID=451379 RepID=A0A0N5ABM8_9BILA